MTLRAAHLSPRRWRAQRARWQRSFEPTEVSIGYNGGTSPRSPHVCTASERTVVAREPRKPLRCTADVGHGHYFEIPQHPRKGGTGWKGSHEAREYRRIGRQHRNQRETPSPPGIKVRLKKVACRPFDAPARSQPAQTTQSPLTRPHVC